MPKNWIQSVEKEMKEDNTEGSFSAKAKKAGKSTHDYAMEVIKKYKGKDNTAAQERLLKQAVLALNFEKMRKKKSGDKDKPCASCRAKSQTKVNLKKESQLKKDERVLAKAPAVGVSPAGKKNPAGERKKKK